MSSTGPDADVWDELLDAWAIWTAAPGDRTAAVRLTAACQPIGALLAVPTHQVSALLADQLRAGLNRPEAVEALRTRAEGT